MDSLPKNLKNTNYQGGVYNLIVGGVKLDTGGPKTLRPQIPRNNIGRKLGNFKRIKRASFGNKV